MKVLAVLLLFVCGALHAQTSLVVKDANGKVIGVPVSLQANERAIEIITPQGNLLSLSQWDGHLEYYGGYRVYESTDCTGAGYLDHHFRSASPKFVELDLGTIALLPATPTVKTVDIRSNDYMGCGQYAEPTPKTVVDPTVYIVNPEDHGFEWSSAQNRWIIPVPFSIESIEAEGVFCSGFEGCPPQ